MLTVALRDQNRERAGSIVVGRSRDRRRRIAMRDELRSAIRIGFT